MLFGGRECVRCLALADTWEYDGTWVEITPLRSPPGRQEHAMAYDQGYQAIVLFGGVATIGNGSSSDFVDDTWVYLQQP